VASARERDRWDVKYLSGKEGGKYGGGQGREGMRMGMTAREMGSGWDVEEGRA